MKYKYKDDVKKVLFEEHRVASDPTVLNTAFNMRDELDEVYAKAQAFDEIAQIYDENTGLGEQDEDSTNFETLVGEVGSVINSVESGDSE